MATAGCILFGAVVDWMVVRLPLLFDPLAWSMKSLRRGLLLASYLTAAAVGPAVATGESPGILGMPLGGIAALLFRSAASPIADRDVAVSRDAVLSRVIAAVEGFDLLAVLSA